MSMKIWNYDQVMNNVLQALTKAEFEKHKN